jgi:hypothetical protein
MNKFYAVKLLQDGVEVGYLGFDSAQEPILVDLEYAAFYVVKEDVEYDAAKCVTELVKYTSKIVTVSMNVTE